MKTNHLRTFSLSLMLGLVLYAGAGCKKKEAASDTPPVAANTKEPTPPVTEAKATVQTAVSVKPAPDENTIAEGHAFPSLEFASLSGDQVNLANLKGKVVLVDKNGAVHFNTDYEQEKYPLHGAELRNVVAKLCSAPAH